MVLLESHTKGNEIWKELFEATHVIVIPSQNVAVHGKEIFVMQDFLESGQF